MMEFARSIETRVTDGFDWPLLVLMLALILGPSLAKTPRLPATVGLVLAGMVLGPHCTRLLKGDEIALQAWGTFGLLYLMFSAALELNVRLLAEMKKIAVTFAFLSFAIPFSLGTVLFKNAEAIEVMRKVDTLVVDKTGTLTEGKPKLTSIIPAGSFDEPTLLRLAATLERGSEHPLAAAIVEGAVERGVRPGETGRFESITGKGVRGTVDGREVALGNRTLLTDLAVDLGALAQQAEALRGDGQTVMFVVVDGKPAGLLGVADPIKESTPEAIRALHDEGIRVVMLTGDNQTTARAVAKKLQIDEVIAEVLPDQKVDAVKRLQGEGRFVAMAGDGINDAPALARAQVGIAMGTGTDVAMESAAVTLVKGDLRGIVRARRLSRQTMRNIKENLFFAFLYNSAGIPIAAGVLYPFFGVLLSPVIAAAAMSFSSVSVVGNALRLRGAEL